MASQAGRKDSEDDPLYRAPALEKGLDVLELLAKQEHPLTVSAIAQRLERSTSELFRMIQVLERRNYVVQGREGYSLTSRLFRLGLQRPPLRNLVETALPRMRELSALVGHACHLVLHSEGEMVVVARMESQEPLGYSVRVGYRRPLFRATSGIVLYAFQPNDVRRRWETFFNPRLSARETADLKQAAALAVEQGHLCRPSAFVEGVVDLSAPVLRGEQAVAALAIPFMRLKTFPITEEEVLSGLVQAAASLSGDLLVADSRT